MVKDVKILRRRRYGWEEKAIAQANEEDANPARTA
jgi:hypothetical protein